MKKLIDEKGRFLGRLYDYEYLGRKREKKRAGEPGRANVRSGLMALALFGLGLWVAAQSLRGGGGKSPGEMVFVVLLIWFWAALILYLRRRSGRRYRALCAALKRREPGI